MEKSGPLQTTRESPKPSFTFVGPSKSGSSWFFEILHEHPQVFVPPNKSTFFFCHHYERGIPWYEGFFAGAGRARSVGEVCHDYLASPEALSRIRAYQPDMRLICCLRNPYERALSAWRFFRRNGMDLPTLAAQAANDPGVFEQGNYASQLTNLQSLFPRSQILIFFFEELAQNPATVARRLYEFIGVDPTFKPPTLATRVNVNANPRSRHLARLMQIVHGQSWKGSRSMSNLVGQIKRIKLLRRLVRVALYQEHRTSRDWREHLGDFPSEIVSRYENEISGLEAMLGVNLAHWHAMDPKAERGKSVGSVEPLKIRDPQRAGDPPLRAPAAPPRLASGQAVSSSPRP